MTARPSPGGPVREPDMIINPEPHWPGFGQTMSKGTPAQNHNAHSTLETTPEIIPDTQGPWAPLRGASKCGEMEEKEKQKAVGTLK